jgi:hypothetical protein
MKTIITYGVLIAVLCGIWELVMGVTGWYRDPALMNIFYAVIVIQIVLMFKGLSITAAERTYGGQVIAGVLMSFVAGLLIILISLLFTSVMYPHYFEEVRSAIAEGMRRRGMGEAEINAEISAMSAVQSPIANAMAGFFGTVATGFAASLVIAVFRRKKPAAA